MGIPEQFIKFDEDNPHVYELFCKFTWQAINAGRRHFGAAAVWQRMRWYTQIEAADRYSSFKLNNNYHPHYARKFMDDNPEYEGFFRTRELRNV